MSRAPERGLPRAWAGGALWLAPALVFGLFTWVSFLYIGTRARRRDWLLAGAGYALAAAFLMTAFARLGDYDDPDGTLTAAMMVTWVGGLAHVLLANVSWRRNRDLLAPAGAGGRSRRRAAPGTAVPAGPENFGLGDPAEEFLADRPPALAAPDAVDVNKASARRLGRLPGVGTSLARRIVAERERLGGFDDLDHLARAAGLQPHVMVGLEGRVTFSPVVKKTPPGGPEEPRGRVLDV